MPTRYLGIDVQTRRPPAWMALDSNLEIVDSGWLANAAHREVYEDAAQVIQDLENGGKFKVITGIDSPRLPRPGRRQFYSNGTNLQWRNRSTQVGHGRHCEVIIKSTNTANPQWTPTKSECKEWMLLGFKLFNHLEQKGHETHEVFPSASHTMLEGDNQLRVSIDFSSFMQGPKDMIDACIAALTIREFDEGRGTEVGSDGLGTIALPRPLPDNTPRELLAWPG